MRVYFKILFVVALVLCLSGNLFAYTIDDITKVGIGYTTDSGDNHRGMTDVLGASGYETFGIDISLTGNIATFDLFTRFAGSGSAGPVSLGFADIFFKVGGSDYNYAIDMDTEKIYHGVSSYNRSEDYLQGQTGTSTWAYGRYWGEDTSAPSPIVKRTDGVSAASLISYGSSLSGGIYQYTMSFYLNDIGVNPGDSFDIFWATAYCANDIVEGSLDVNPVPEPATILLLGSGLVGLVGMGRKKRSKNSLP